MGGRIKTKGTSDPSYLTAGYAVTTETCRWLRRGRLFSATASITRFNAPDYRGMARLILAVWVGLPLLTTVADVVQLNPDKDTTIFSNPVTDLSNGEGQYLFAGVTGVNNSFETRRALIRFDLQSAIHSGSIITSATLRLRVAKSPNGAPPALVTVHRVQQNWGEGASNATGNEGSGTSALPGDATWRHTNYSNTFWNTPGGDFISQASASTLVSGVSFVNFSGWGLVSDVQLMVNGTHPNFGWILLGDERFTRNARSFNSRNGADEDVVPVLEIGFTPVPEPGALVLLIMGILCLRYRKKANWT